MRAALYARVSTEEQAEKFGLAAQLEDLRAFAALRGHSVPDGAEFVDDGWSGAELARPALDRLREAARTGAVQVICVYDPDRLSRRLAHQLVLVEEFERAGVAVEFVTTPREDTPEGRLLLHVKSVIAEYEREKIRERTLRGKREKARRGLIPAGPIPYGYRADSRQPGRLVVHEDEASVVRMLFRWLVEERRSIREITAELRHLGIAPPRGPAWARSSVRRIVTGEVYAGRAWFNRRARTHAGVSLRQAAEWLPIPVPAILPPGVFERAQAQLARNREIRSGRPGRRAYLLKGLLRCGACGRRYAGIPSHGRRYYRCAGRDRLAWPDRCRAPRLAAEAIESLVWETVTAVLRQPGLLAEKVAAYRTRIGPREVEIQSEAASLERQLAEAARHEGKLLDLYLDDALRGPILADRLRAVQERKARLEDRLAVVRRQLANQAAEAARQDGVARYCELALEGLEALDEAGRRALLLALIDEVVVRPRALEIRGVLPGRWLPSVGDHNRAESQEIRPGYDPTEFLVSVPI